MCAFQRQCHEFHEPSGPPWTKATSGAGASAEASAGRISQEPIGVPSAAVEGSPIDAYRTGSVALVQA